jgi:hypothetical protein
MDLNHQFCHSDAIGHQMQLRDFSFFVDKFLNYR